ncbi:MAG: hypothetical protein ILP02_04225 [Clostridia bacterium]|nr:hypothetical protein [Clostridia bacterium]
MKSNEDYKKYNVSVRFLKTVGETRTQIEDRAKYLLSVLSDLESKYARLQEEKAEFDDADQAEEESTVAFLKKKSQEITKAFAEMEKEIESLTAEMTELVNQYKKLSSDSKQMREQYETSKVKVAEISKVVEKERADITEKLAAIAKDIPPELMNKYKAARKSSKFPLVYLLTEKDDLRHCVACGTELSALSVTKLKKDKFIECENCRKLIFME